MQTQSIGNSSLRSPRLTYGCMRLTPWNVREITHETDKKAFAAIQAALDSGYTFFDHADIYGGGQCERVFGDFLSQNPTVRDKITIATKCGIQFSPVHQYNFSKQHILQSAAASLQRLRIETIDLYQLHRPDYLMNPSEIADAFDTLHKQGKVRYFGVSNFKPSTLSALQSGLSAPLIVNQVQISLADLHTLDDGTLDQCIERNITPLAWSPIAGGVLGEGGKLKDDHPRKELLSKLIEHLDQLAREYGVSRTVISLAWLLHHPAKIVPIVGSTNPAHIADSVKADKITFTREQWYTLLIHARGTKLP